MLLTKSNYLNGLKCPKLLFRAINKEIPKPTFQQLHIFEQGTEVGILATKLFNGTQVETDFKANLAQTQQ